MRQTYTTIAVAIILVATAVTGLANEVIYNSDLQSGKVCTEFNLAKNIGRGLGMFAYAANSITWSEAYIGPTFSPSANIQIGIAAGTESNQTSTRFGSFLWAGHGRASFLLLGEDGGSGPWVKVEGKYALDDKTLVGVLQEINLGTGLLIERKLDSAITLRLRLYGGGKGDAGVKLAF